VNLIAHFPSSLLQTATGESGVAFPAFFYLFFTTVGLLLHGGVQVQLTLLHFVGAPLPLVLIFPFEVKFLVLSFLRPGRVRNRGALPSDTPFLFTVPERDDPRACAFASFFTACCSFIRFVSGWRLILAFFS